MEFTAEQLAEIEKMKQEAVSKAVAEKEAELTKTHNSAMASVRKKNDEDLAKAVEKAKREATMSAEELAKQETERLMKEKEERLSFLENEYKKSNISKKLAEANVPAMFVNDSRLLNASEEELPGVIDVIKGEYSKLMPNGSQVSTNVQVSTSTSAKTEKERKFEEFAKMR